LNHNNHYDDHVADHQAWGEAAVQEPHQAEDRHHEHDQYQQQWQRQTLLMPQQTPPMKLHWAANLYLTLDLLHQVQTVLEYNDE